MHPSASDRYSWGKTEDSPSCSTKIETNEKEEEIHQDVDTCPYDSYDELRLYVLPLVSIGWRRGSWTCMLTKLVESDVGNIELVLPPNDHASEK